MYCERGKGVGETSIQLIQITSVESISWILLIRRIILEDETVTQTYRDSNTL